MFLCAWELQIWRANFWKIVLLTKHCNFSVIIDKHTSGVFSVFSSFGGLFFWSFRFSLKGHLTSPNPYFFDGLHFSSFVCPHAPTQKKNSPPPAAKIAFLSVTPPLCFYPIVLFSLSLRLYLSISLSFFFLVLFLSLRFFLYHCFVLLLSCLKRATGQETIENVRFKIPLFFFSSFLLSTRIPFCFIFCVFFTFAFGANRQNGFGAGLGLQHKAFSLITCLF